MLAVIPYSRAGIVGAVLLGLGRALGETMAVTMVIGNSPQISASLFAAGLQPSGRHRQRVRRGDQQRARRRAGRPGAHPLRHHLPPERRRAAPGERRPEGPDGGRPDEPPRLVQLPEVRGPRDGGGVRGLLRAGLHSADLACSGWSSARAPRDSRGPSSPSSRSRSARSGAASATRCWARWPWWARPASWGSRSGWARASTWPRRATGRWATRCASWPRCSPAYRRSSSASWRTRWWWSRWGTSRAWPGPWRWRSS